MSARDSLNGMQFQYTKVDTGGRPMHRLEAVHPDHGVVGKMDWSVKQIRNIDVEPEHRRQGIATALWEKGQSIRPTPKHSDQRTDAGDAWARTVGGRLPRRDRT